MLMVTICGIGAAAGRLTCEGGRGYAKRRCDRVRCAGGFPFGARNSSWMMDGRVIDWAYCPRSFTRLREISFFMEVVVTGKLMRAVVAICEVDDSNLWPRPLPARKASPNK